MCQIRGGRPTLGVYDVVDQVYLIHLLKKVYLIPQPKIILWIRFTGNIVNAFDGNQFQPKMLLNLPFLLEETEMLIIFLPKTKC